MPTPYFSKKFVLKGGWALTRYFTVIALKGAIRDFYNLLTAPQTVRNTYAQLARVQSCTNHMQQIKRLSHATCSVCHLVRRDNSDIKLGRVEIAFIWAFVLLAETIIWWRYAQEVQRTVYTWIVVSQACLHTWRPGCHTWIHRLVGTVVKANLGFDSCLHHEDFSGLSRTRDLKIGTPEATLPGAWHYRVSAGTGWPGVSIPWLGEVKSLICNFYLSMAAGKIV